MNYLINPVTRFMTEAGLPFGPGGPLLGASKAAIAIRKIFQNTKLYNPSIKVGPTKSRLQLGKGRYQQSAITPINYFRNKNYTEIEMVLTEKFGPARGVGPHNKSFYNPRSKRTYNLHQDPLHYEGKPHVDIRKRGLPSDYYDPFF